MLLRNDAIDRTPGRGRAGAGVLGVWKSSLHLPTVFLGLLRLTTFAGFLVRFRTQAFHYYDEGQTGALRQADLVDLLVFVDDEVRGLCPWPSRPPATAPLTVFCMERALADVLAQGKRAHGRPSHRPHPRRRAPLCCLVSSATIKS